MRFLQICSFYPEYLAAFRSERPQLAQQPYHQQLAALVDDGFGAQHLFGVHFHQLGYESGLIITNDLALQSRWAAENGVILPQNWQMEIVRRQVEAFRPDIIYLNDPFNYGSEFIRSLSFKPALVVAWSVFAPPPGTDLSAIDLILTSNFGSAQESLGAGVKWIENFLPGMPEELLKQIPQNQKKYDLILCGQVSCSHKRRLNFLQRIAQSALRTGRFTPAFFIQTTPEMPAEVQHFAHPACWGIRMLQNIALSKIGFHLTIDSAGKKAGGMRLFETTFVGSLFLGEDDPSLSTYFKKGEEIATFTDEGDLESKILHYVSNDAERERISKRGHERCLKDHSMRTRLVQLDKMLQYYVKKLGRPTSVPYKAPPLVENIPTPTPAVSAPAVSVTSTQSSTVATVSQPEQNLLSHYPDVSFGSLVQIIGVANTSIGKGSAIGDNCWLNVCIRDSEVRLKIGKGVLVGRGSVLSTAGHFEMGDFCLLGPSVYIADSDHCYQDIETPIIMQGVTTNRRMIVEENCWFGMHAVVSGSLTIGRGSVVGGNSVVTMDVPPFSVVAGNPGRIVKMYNPRTKLWERCSQPGAMEQILSDREQYGIPSREEYRAKLNSKAGDFKVDPITVGRGVWW